MASSLREVWEARKKILEGMMNNIFKKEDIEEVALKRLEICSKCEFIDKTGDTCFLPGSQPCCSKCGCKLAWKVRCLSEGCDEEKWEAILTPDEEEELKAKFGIKDEEHN